jgi:hypothetical protein
MKDNLRYIIVADKLDEIILSSLFEHKTDFNGFKFSMPSLIVKVDGKEIFYADNEDWIIDFFYPAAQRFVMRKMIKGDDDIIIPFINLFPINKGVNYSVQAVIDVIEEAIEIGMLNKEPKVQASVASKA